MDKVDEIKEELNALLSKGNDEEVNLFMNIINYQNDLNSMLYFLNYFPEIKNEVTNLKNKCNNLKKHKKIKNILEELKKEEIYDYIKERDKNQKSNYIQMFNYFYENRQALDFLFNHNTDDIIQLYDKIGPNNTTLSMSAISDTLNCVGFLQELKTKNKFKEIFEFIKSKMNDNDIFEWFKNYSENYRSVIELYQNFDFSLNIYEQINVIINDAYFFSNKNTDVIKYKINNKKENEEEKIISIEKIKELKNKIQIKQERKNSLKNGNTNKFYEKYEKLKFFKLVSTNIEEIYDLMNILRTKGSTLPISIQVEIKYPDVKYYLGKDNKSFKEIQEFLTKAKFNIIKKLDSIYKQMTNVRFLYGRQIDSMLSHIQGNFPIDSFLRFILNKVDCEERVEEGEKEFFRKADDYINHIDLFNNDSFEIIHKYIDSLFIKNNLTLEDHYKKISIKKNYSLKGIYKYFSQSVSMEEDIIQIFLDKIGKIPIAQNILFNNKETSFEEMQAFFNRAILCKYNTLFVVKVSNSFSDYQQRCMNILIDKSLTYKNEKFNEIDEENQVDKSDTSAYMDSCLVFVYNKESESFLNILKVFNPKELNLKREHELRRTTTVENISKCSSFEKDIFREEICKKTHIIQSNICGLGKSTFIKKQILDSGKQYKYFPLGGNITKEKIYLKLKKLMKDIPKENKYNDIAIHLDLFESNEYSVINEFLFSFLITKFYSSNENIIYIPLNIEIFVEIPNCFKDFISNYKILTLFKPKTYITNIPKLNLSEDKIKLLDNMLGLKTNEEIFNWVKKNIGIKSYSYHQIHIFINLFISQYNKFQGAKLAFFSNNKDVTIDCIKSFAKGTEYFTNGGFSKLLLDGNNESGKDEIDILSTEYNNDLKNENFEKKLIFIIKNKMLYYNLDISETALKNGEALYKLDDNQKIEREKKKQNMSPEYLEKLEYLGILKKI